MKRMCTSLAVILETPGSISVKKIPIPPVPGPSVRVQMQACGSCGRCEYCRSGRENLCSTMEHFGHSAGWQEMQYYPGGMSEQFDIWEGFAHEIPPQVSFEQAIFLDGLAVAVHAVDQSGLQPCYDAGRAGWLKTV